MTVHIKYRQRLKPKFEKITNEKFHYWGYIDNGFHHPVGLIEAAASSERSSGIPDANGVEVYAGDILASTRDDKLLKWLVIDQGFSFAVKNIPNSTSTFIVDDPLFFCDRVIVGNIHDNPEMLESDE